MNTCTRCNQRGAILNPHGEVILAVLCPDCGGTGFIDYQPPNRTGKLDPDKVAKFVNEVARIINANLSTLLATTDGEVKQQTGASMDLNVAMAALRVVEPHLLEIDFKPCLRMYLQAAHALDAQYPDPFGSEPKPQRKADWGDDLGYDEDAWLRK